MTDAGSELFKRHLKPHLSIHQLA